MIRFLIRRAVLGLVTLWAIVTLVFVLFQATPGHDPATLLVGRAAAGNQQALASVRKEFGLDKPVWEQYGIFLGKAVHFDFGNSTSNAKRPVIEIIRGAFPIDLALAVGGAVLWVTLGVGVGILAARKPRGWMDRSATVFVLMGISMPTFVLGLLLLYIFYFFFATQFHLHIFPGEGWPTDMGPLEWIHHLLLPWITLALITAATYARLTRSSLLETLGEDYIRTARAKGLSERRVVYRHGLRSALTPLVTQFGIDFATVLGGAIVTEQVFGLPGLGQTVVSAVTNQDIHIIEGVVIVAATFVIVANIAVDALYAVLDPRVRIQ